MRAGHFIARCKISFPILLMLVAVLANIQLGVSSGSKRLTSAEVCQLLQGGVPSSRVASLVEERGIDFVMTPQTETQIREAGATDDLIVTLRLASKPAAKNAPATVDGPRALRQAKTLCVVIDPESSPALKTEIARELAKWGRLDIVRSPEEADLLLNVQQTGSLYKDGRYEGNQAAATLQSRRSGAELWSVTKGGGWSLRGYRPGWVGRAIAKDFIKFYEATAEPSPDAR